MKAMVKKPKDSGSSINLKNLSHHEENQREDQSGRAASVEQANLGRKEGGQQEEDTGDN